MKAVIFSVLAAVAFGQQQPQNGAIQSTAFSQGMMPTGANMGSSMGMPYNSGISSSYPYQQIQGGFPGMGSMGYPMGGQMGQQTGFPTSQMGYPYNQMGQMTGYPMGQQGLPMGWGQTTYPYGQISQSTYPYGQMGQQMGYPMSQQGFPQSGMGQIARGWRYGSTGMNGFPSTGMNQGQTGMGQIYPGYPMIPAQGYPQTGMGQGQIFPGSNGGVMTGGYPGQMNNGQMNPQFGK